MANVRIIPREVIIDWLPIKTETILQNPVGFDVLVIVPDIGGESTDASLENLRLA